MNTNPALLTVAVYVPLISPVNENAPEELEVVVADVGPAKVTVEPLAPGPLIVPERLNVCATDVADTDAFAPFTTTDWLAGV